MKKYFYTLPILLLAQLCVATLDDTTRILFIGNSYTQANNLTDMVKAFANAAGKPAITGMWAPGGITVGDIAQGPYAHMNNPIVFNLIRSKKWDFVVIQDNQGRFVADSALFPAQSLVVQGHLKLRDSVKANNPCARVVLFAGWVTKNGTPPYGNSGVESIRRVLTNYRVLNTTMKEIVAPIGEAWLRVINEFPFVDLWSADLAHPANEGSFLTAMVLYSTMFNLPVKTNAYVNSLDGTVADQLKDFSDAVVFDPAFHAMYNMGPLLINNNGSLSVQGSTQTVDWYLNGTLQGNSAVFIPTVNGVYHAALTTTANCKINTNTYAVTATGLPEIPVNNELRIYPNPLRGTELHVEQGNGSGSCKVELMDLYGRILQTHDSSTSTLHLEHKLPAGCYYLKITDDRHNTVHIKLITE